jgi:hypothetical protein
MLLLDEMQINTNQQEKYKCTDSFKPSLQFSCNFVVINASKGSLSFQIFIIISSFQNNAFYGFELIQLNPNRVQDT